MLPYGDPLQLTWFDLALTGSKQVFANAVHFQDHCFDVAGEADYAEVAASIMALAGEEWPGATVSASYVQRPGRYGQSRRVEIVIQGQGGAPPFDLIVDKDFDWSVVTRLNERLLRKQPDDSSHSSTAMPPSSIWGPIRSRSWESFSGTTLSLRSSRWRSGRLCKGTLRQHAPSSMYIGGVGLFLGGPAYLIARKWRSPRRLPGRAE